MADVRTILSGVWSELQQANVVDDLAIIEYIAALLVEEKIELEGSAWPFDEQLKPQKPRVRYNPDDERLKSQLRSAMRELPGQIDQGIPQHSPTTIAKLLEQYQQPIQNQSKNIAILFDQHILFVPSRYIDRGTHPTPRYIIDFMLNILQIRPEHSFADFACGSGSFLIRRVQQQSGAATAKQKGETLGIDIAVEWVRIALANIFFHNQQNNIKVQIGNAFRLFNKPGKLADHTFDRIALSPPSENIITQEGSFPTEDIKQTGDSAFTSLLLDQLKATGRAAVMVSEDLIMSSNANQYNLRRQLIDRQYLRAVITQRSNEYFPRSLATYILYIDKNSRTKTDFVWLCDIGENDFILYERERSPNEFQNVEDYDLLFFQKIVHITGKDGDFDVLENNKPFRQKKIFLNHTYLGLVIRANPGMKIESIRYDQSHSDSQLFISVQTPQSTNDTYTVRLEKASRDVSIEQLPLLSSAINSGHLIFANSDEGQLIAISADGRLLGVTKTSVEIASESYSLLPLNHLKRHSAAEIAENRASTSMSETNELYITEEISIQQERALPHISHHTSALLRLLNAKQRAIWRLIEQNYSTDQYALHFTPEHVQRLSNQADVTSTLALLEHMGLIRRVTLAGTQNQPAQQLYRRMIATEVVTATNTKIEIE